MNGGIIADRYARAFYMFADRRGTVDKVYDQIRLLLSVMRRLPKFRKALENMRAVSLGQRLELLTSAVAPSPLCDEIESIYRMMDEKGRLEYFQLMMLDFLEMYRTAHNIRMIRITTVDDDTTLDEKVSELFKEKYNCSTVITHRKNPDIVGGFILESWGYRLDASVASSLDNLRKQLKRN